MHACKLFAGETAADGRVGTHAKKNGIVLGKQLIEVPIHHGAATIFSGVKPNFSCKALSGAEAPKVCMPMICPRKPT